MRILNSALCTDGYVIIGKLKKVMWFLMKQIYPLIYSHWSRMSVEAKGVLRYTFYMTIKQMGFQLFKTPKNYV